MRGIKKAELLHILNNKNGSTENVLSPSRAPLPNVLGYQHTGTSWRMYFFHGDMALLEEGVAFE